MSDYILVSYHDVKVKTWAIRMYFIVKQNKVEERNTYLDLVTSDLSLLVLPAPIYFLNCFLDLSQLCLSWIMLL